MIESKIINACQDEIKTLSEKLVRQFITFTFHEMNVPMDKLLETYASHISSIASGIKTIGDGAKLTEEYILEMLYITPGNISEVDDIVVCNRDSQSGFPYRIVYREASGASEILKSMCNDAIVLILNISMLNSMTSRV